MTVKFQLDRIAMNTSFALFEDMMIKFAYVIEYGKPKLEIFSATKEARENDWQIYGPNPNTDQEIVVVQFSEISDVRDFRLLSKCYRLKYIQLEKYEISYARRPDERVQEDRYTFEIEKMYIS